MYRVGILALQGDVSEHVLAMQKVLGSRGEAITIRAPGQIAECDGLVLPGGESTTISRQLESSGMIEELKTASALEKPILATCAGLVLVANEIDDNSNVKPLGLMDIKISRNVFGSQRESFETDLQVKGLDRPYHAVFIRAPAIVATGKNVEVLAKVSDYVVAARQKNVIALAFHPELTEDMRFHEIFLEIMEARNVFGKRSSN